MQLPTSLSTKAWRLGILVPGILGLASSLHAQTSELPQRWMDWTVLPFYSHAQCTVDKSLAAQTVLNLQKIVLAFVRFNPGYPTTGYFDTRLGATSEAGCGRAPVAGQISITVLDENQVVIPAGGKEGARIKRGRTEGGLGAFDLSVNVVPFSLSTKFEVDFASSSENNNPLGIMIYPQPTSTFQGYPVLDHIVITPAGYPPFYTPVKLEHVLKLAVALHEKQFAAELQNSKEEEARMSDDGEYIKGMKRLGATEKQLLELKNNSTQIVAQRLQQARADLDVLKRRLEQLTPADKVAPAYVKRAPSNAYIPQAEPDDGAEPLVMPNPAYFDKQVARSVPQLLVIGGFDDTKLDGPEPVAEWQAVQRVDWNALAKELLH